ncbi:HAMP domain-containing sensor histidine kinase [Rhizobium leguminosarum]|uniref:sensor histidine kinase n=1 Tax=Rhizobium leguminosarum TaxID=384 RepID=UPI0028F45BBE|nr:HAMP domain-containing sensor histidine kinase [Rhizobium leguminosarum]
MPDCGATASKTAFFSNVSHEFRTPLTLLLGPLEEVLLKNGLDQRTREALGVSQRNALRLLRLVNTLLDFSRIEAGQADATFKRTDIAALTADLASNFRSACERAGISLSIDCSARSSVFVDRDMWEKIVLNLISNAFKFTTSGGISVITRGDDASFVLEVCDTGVGIPAGDRAGRFTDEQGVTVMVLSFTAAVQIVDRCTLLRKNPLHCRNVKTAQKTGASWPMKNVWLIS